MRRKRRLDDWVAGYLEYSKGSESPISYNRWGAIACISSALQRKCYLQQGLGRIYPNQFILLVGPTGGRKGQPIDLAAEMMRLTRLNVLAESATAQAVVKTIADSAMIYKQGSRLLFHSSVCASVHELMNFVSVGGDEFRGWLTDWYDSRSKFKYATKHQGEDDIIGVCMTLFAASAPSWFPHIFPHNSIGGGFSSRFIFVVEHGKRQIVLKEPAPDKKLFKALQTDLTSIAQMIGPFRMTPGALEVYEEFYLETDRNPPISDPSFVGYNNRRQTHLRKVAMALSAGRRSTRMVEKQDMLDARDMLLEIEPRMPDAFIAIGRARWIEQTMLILSYIEQNSPCKRSDLLMTLYKDIDEWTLGQIETTLKRMRCIEAKGGSKDKTYTFLRSPVNGALGALFSRE